MRVQGMVTARELLAKKGLQDGADKPSQNLVEQAKMQRIFESVVKHLKAHGHGGKIVVPLAPNILNLAGSSNHWRKRDLKEAYGRQLGTLLFAGLMPVPPAEPPERAEISVRMFVFAEMDYENLRARNKWICDWLIGQRYIFDDKPKNLEWGSVEQYVDRDCQRIEITLREVE
jgi:hypothetical protein